MRVVLVAATLSLLAACNDPAASGNAGAPDADEPAATTALTPVDANQSAGAMMGRMSAEPAMASSRVMGPQLKFSWDVLAGKGGITRSLGEPDDPLTQHLSGRWGYDCASGAGALSFWRDGRFRAPGGNGRYAVEGFLITFTFDDGAVEQWEAEMEPGRLSLRRKGASGQFDRMLCADKP